MKIPKESCGKGLSPEENPRNPAFWIRLSNMKAPHPMTSRSLTGECWDKAAATYDDLESCSDYMNQVNTIISTLLERDILARDKNVIDIACGTGTYSVRMAPYAKRVTALDVSSAMLEKLAEKKERMGLENIEIVHSDWNGFKSDEQFDMVFVSMTPLLRSLKNIDRMLALSSRYLAIVSWAGIRENSLLNSLFMELMGEIPHKSDMKRDIMIPFNYLYTKGYAPDLQFFHGCWERTRSVERQVESLLWQLEMYRPLEPDEKDLVRKKVEQLASKDLVTVKTRVRTCFMLVDKKAGELRC